MSTPSMRRFGALLVVILLLTAVLVPAAAAAPAPSNASGASQGAGSCPVYYRVVRGDTLTRIAYRYGVTVYQLQQWNNIWNIDRIYAGQRLVIYRACPRPQPPPPPHPYPYPHPWPQPAPGAWQATYYNTTNFTGPVVLQRPEGRPCYNWGWGSPAPQVAPDNFTVRWTTSSNVTGGTYRFSVRTDDGARLYIDGRPVLDEWREQSVRGYFVEVWLTPGWHSFAIEYLELTGVAEFCYSSQRL